MYVLEQVPASPEKGGNDGAVVIGSCKQPDVVLGANSRGAACILNCRTIISLPSHSSLTSYLRFLSLFLTNILLFPYLL